MRIVPSVPVCPLCGGASWRRERFFPLEAERPTARVVILARCRGCGLRRYFWPDERRVTAVVPGLEGSEQPVKFLAGERAHQAGGGPAELTVTNGSLWHWAAVLMGTEDPRTGPRRLWLFDRRTLRRAVRAAGWRAGSMLPVGGGRRLRLRGRS